LKIGTLVTPVLGNVHANFWYTGQSGSLASIPQIWNQNQAQFLPQFWAEVPPISDWRKHLTTKD